MTLRLRVVCALLVLLCSTAVLAQGNPSNTPTATPTLTPLPTAPGRPAGMSSVLTLLNETTTTTPGPDTGPPTDVSGFGSGTLHIAPGADCGNFTLNLQATNINSGDVPWYTIASFTQADVTPGTGKVVAVTPFPVQYLRVRPTLVATPCTILVRGAFRP